MQQLWIMFDKGKDPTPVLVNKGQDLPKPEDLICVSYGHDSLVGERVIWAQTGREPSHDYQWLGPFHLPVDQELLPRVFDDNPDEDEVWSFKDGPWGRSKSYETEKNPHGVIFYIPGYDEVPLDRIPTAYDCRDAVEESQVGYLTHCYLS